MDDLYFELCFGLCLVDWHKYAAHLTVFLSKVSQAPSVAFTGVWCPDEKCQPALNNWKLLFGVFSAIQIIHYTDCSCFAHSICVLVHHCKPCLLWAGQALFLARGRLSVTIFFLKCWYCWYSALMSLFHIVPELSCITCHEIQWSYMSNIFLCIRAVVWNPFGG